MAQKSLRCAAAICFYRAFLRLPPEKPARLSLLRPYVPTTFFCAAQFEFDYWISEYVCLVRAYKQIMEQGPSVENAGEVQLHEGMLHS